MTEQNLSDETTIKLTQYSRGAGCGCKIAPSVLHEILQNNYQQTDDNLIIGNNTNDDAAVYDIGNGKAIISTTDFFMPIVDDAVDFGKIASANAISDIYAMGGKPLMAIAVLGWPIEKLSPALAKKVIEGAREVCSLAGISLAGGHSIDSTEPIFGLAVTGIIDKENIKKNNTAQEGDLLFITKSIGVGILSTAQKRGLIQPNHTNDMIHQMSHLNNIGENLGKIAGVSAMTDVTGFGLLGHAIEMAEGAALTLELYYASIPVISGAKEYLSQRIVPDATYRNWNSYSTKTSFEKGVNVMEAFNLLPDPQTNGGLLFSVKESAVAEIVALMKETGYQDFIEPIGRFVKKTDKTIIVKNQ
jgi:selenide,water dikinase